MSKFSLDYTHSQESSLTNAWCGRYIKAGRAKSCIILVSFAMANSTVSVWHTGVTNDFNQFLLITNNSSASTNTFRNFSWDLISLKVMCCAPRKNYTLLQVMCDSVFFPVIHSRKIAEPEISSASKTILMALYSVIIFVSLVGNMLVLITVCGNRNMRSVTNVFILSLSVSDLLLALIATPINMGNVMSTYWKYGAFACKIVPCITTFCVACSSLTLCCIAFERF